MFYSNYPLFTQKYGFENAQKSYTLMFKSNMIEQINNGNCNFTSYGIEIINKIYDLPITELKHLFPFEIKTSDFSVLSKQVKQFPKFFYQKNYKISENYKQSLGLLQNKNYFEYELIHFDKNIDNFNQKLNEIIEIFKNIFQKLNINHKIVKNNKKISFYSIIDEGIESLFRCNSCDYFSDVENVESFIKKNPENGQIYEFATENNGQIYEFAPTDDELLLIPEKIFTPDIKTINQLEQYLNIPKSKFIKTMIYNSDGEKILFLLRGDFNVDENKLKKYLNSKEFNIEDEKFITKILGLPVGFLGPINMSEYRIIADNSIKSIVNGVCGANEINYHIKNVNVERDFKVDEWGNFIVVNENDNCPKCKTGLLKKQNGVNFCEVDISEKESCLISCYRININKLFALIIEGNNDEKGIVLPNIVSPFDVIITVLNGNNENVKLKVEEINKILTNIGLKVLIDDRNESAGVKFVDSELIGIPIRITISNKSIENDLYEVVLRKNDVKEKIKFEQFDKHFYGLKT